MATFGFFPPKATISIIYYSTEQLFFQSRLQRVNFHLFHAVSRFTYQVPKIQLKFQQKIKIKFAQNNLRAMIFQYTHPWLIYLLFEFITLIKLLIKGLLFSKIMLIDTCHTYSMNSWKGPIISQKYLTTSDIHFHLVVSNYTAWVSHSDFQLLRFVFVPRSQLSVSHSRYLRNLVKVT